MTNLRRSIAKHIPGFAWMMTEKPQPAAQPRLPTASKPLPDPPKHGRYGLTFEAERFLTPAVASLSGRLKTSQRVKASYFDDASVEALMQMHRLPFGDQVDYLQDHKKRFYELDCISAELLQGEPLAKVLDVGMSVNTVILKQMLPTIDMHVLDRTDVVLDPELPYTLHSVDLTDPSLDTVVLGESFDLILFCEVIEHLLANPVRVLNFFVRHLTPTGSLVITTPNFFARHCLNAMRARKNPQPIFSKAYTRETAISHHVREYSMSELLEFSEMAGGRPKAFFYSACWDKNPEDIREEEWLNLCVIVKRELL